MKLLLVLSLLLALQAATSAVSTPPPTATLYNGTVTLTGATVVESYLRRPIHHFLGIPYAQPPVGGLRFRRPLPWAAPSTPTTRDATKWGSNCVQWVVSYENTTEEYVEHSDVYEEDCLYLNVFTPEVKPSESDKLRPVFFFIHGGSMLWGSGSMELYQGEALADMADVVVVSINYRLSSLGFFYSDKIPEISGNQGLWDQVLAMQWTQQNIRSFGGDPNQVTIVGSSASDWCITAHLLSPISRNLFQNVYLMSASAVTFIAAKSKDKQIENQLKGIRHLGCASEADVSIDEKVVDCLMKLPASKIDKIAYMLDEKSQEFGRVITIDGEFLPDTPQRLLAAGQHKKGFNMLLETTSDEGSFLLYWLDHNDTRFSMNNPTPLKLADAKDYLLKLVAKFVTDPSKLPKETIEKFYFSGFDGTTDDDDAYRRQVGVAFGDLLLGCPPINFARDIFKNSPQDIKVYQIFYNAKLGNARKWACSKWGGTCHADDLGPVFGLPFRYPNKYTNRERDISREFAEIIKNFVRTGTPGPYYRQWNAYFAETINDRTEVIAPYYEIGNAPRASASFGINLRHFECENIWRALIDDANLY